MTMSYGEGVDSPPAVVVVGSINQDYLIQVERRPEVGETVGDGTVYVAGGGKGANQARAVAAAGVSVEMLGLVGWDDAGSRLLTELREADVGIALVGRAANLPTGAAFITVTPDGANAIIVAPAANSALDVKCIARARPRLAEAKVLVVQLEIPTSTACAAIAAAGEATLVILNAAPVGTLDEVTMARVDVLVVNEHEAADMLGTNSSDVAGAAAALLRLGPAACVVTAGGRGAFVALRSGRQWHEPAVAVKVVDTTGAGDTFVGTCAAALAESASRACSERQMRRAVREAVASASRSVGWLGVKPRE